MALGPRGERLLAMGLLVAFALLSILSMRGKSPTFDETAHLPAGISYVQLGDFRMNPEHPALPKLLAGAAASMSGVKAPSTGDAWEQGEQWDYGNELLYESGVDWRRILFLGRLPMVLIGVALGAGLWIWMRALAGPSAAALALALYAFAPNVLAHTRLVTTDVPLTFAVVLTSACLWQAWRTGRMMWVIAAAGGVALTMVTKFSAFSYAPVWALLVVLPSERRSLRAGFTQLGVLVGLSIVLTELAVFVCYGFSTDLTSIRMLGMAGRGVSPEQMSWLRRIPYEVMAVIPWPSAEFARGLKDVILYTEAGHPVYLMGMRADHGWWWSSFVALGVKVPLPLWILFGWSLQRIVTRPELRRRDLAFLLAVPALVLATNVLAKLGLGVRHLLPMIPFVIGVVAWSLHGALANGRARIIGALLLLWYIGGTLATHPHYLAHFNEIARVSGGGARYLGDSNLDWGQDLSLAADRLREHGADGAILCYFGTASPFAEEGLAWQLLPPAQRPKKRDPWTVLSEVGEQWLVVGTTNRQGVYYRPGDSSAEPYPWLAEADEPEVIGGGSMVLYEISREPDMQRGLAAVYRRHGLREEEMAALRRVVELVPYDGTARRRLVDLQIESGDIFSAEFTMFDSPNPDVDMLLLLADVRGRLGDDEAVYKVFERGLQVFSKSAELKNAFAWFLQKIGRELDLALRAADEAVNWSTNDVYYRDTRGMVHFRRGDIDLALADFEFALARPDGNLPDIRWHRALMHVELGRLDEAIAESEELVARDDISVELRDEIEAWRYGIGQ